MKMLPGLVVVVLAVIAGFVPRFWLRAVAAALSALVGLSWVYVAVQWRVDPSPYCGTNCYTFPPPLTPGLSIVAAIGFLALGAVLAWLAARVRAPYGHAATPGE